MIQKNSFACYAGDEMIRSKKMAARGNSFERIRVNNEVQMLGKASSDEESDEDEGFAMENCKALSMKQLPP
jgi:hypothetical protein